jgi:sensor c-di-GMP phosphodiesterase-like protein
MTLLGRAGGRESQPEPPDAGRVGGGAHYALPITGIGISCWLYRQPTERGQLMRKAVALTAVALSALLAIAGPILLALYYARKQGLEAETSHVLAYARDVLFRAEGAADQVADGIDRLVAEARSDPCSEASMFLMRRIDLASSYIQAIGHVSDGRLACSSVGHHAPGPDLGPVDLVTPAGTAIRVNAKFPATGETRFLVLERDGFAAVIHRDIPIDATTVEKDVSLAVFSWDPKQNLSTRGFVKPEWLKAGEQPGIYTFMDSGYLVASVRSKRYYAGAVAAVPVASVEQRVESLALLLVPIGGAAGILLALAILRFVRLQLAMPALIRSGLRRNEFFLAYQPVVDLRSGRWVGAEALIRWRRPSGELVRPDVFIKVAEDSGLIEQVTRHVLKLIARDAGNLFARHPGFHIAINLSPADLKNPRTVELLRRLARAVKAEPQSLIVEATERGFMHADAVSAVIGEIRTGGMRVAIDDFGTGYSSLSYLQSLEVDFLKIDKSFVDTVGTDAATSQVVSHIISMASDLHLEMIAEGVETEAQAKFLRERGVQYAQGWLFGKAMPLAEIVSKLPSSDRAG